MLASLFKYPAVLARHQKAPFLEDREHYLQHRAEQGCAPYTLLRIARELPHVIQFLDIHPTSVVTVQQIEVAAKIWARSQCRRGRAHAFRWSRDLFIQVATDWLRFLGLLDEPVLPSPLFVDFTEQFFEWLNTERGLSTATTSNYSWHANQFLQWCQDYNRSLDTIQASDVDAFLVSRSEKGWCRVSIATCTKALKAFFLYAEQRSWCHPLIARAIQGPRLFQQETLPSGPSWDEVNHIIDSLATDHPMDIRDRAIILLLHSTVSGPVRSHGYVLMISIGKPVNYLYTVQNSADLKSIHSRLLLVMQSSVTYKLSDSTVPIGSYF